MASILHRPRNWTSHTARVDDKCSNFPPSSPPLTPPRVFHPKQLKSSLQLALFNTFSKPHLLTTPPQWKVSLYLLCCNVLSAHSSAPNTSLSPSPPSPSHLQRASTDHFSRPQRRSQLSSSTMGKNHRSPRLPPSLPVGLHVVRHWAASDTISQLPPAPWRADPKLQDSNS